MTVTNKAISLKRLRELKEIFKDNKTVIQIRQYSKEYPFHFLIWFENGLGYDELDKLYNKGYLHTALKIQTHNEKPILMVEVYKQPFEKDLERYEISEYEKMAKTIGTEEYWQVKYHLEKNRLDNHIRRELELAEKNRELEKRIALLFKQLEKIQEVDKK